jgi:hypothetical protein
LGGLSVSVLSMSPEQILAGVRSGNYHLGGIRCLRLFKLEKSVFEEIQAEVIRLVDSEMPSRAGEQGHVTQWVKPTGRVYQYSLFNGSGRTDDFSLDHELASAGKRFHFRDKYPAIAEFVDLFPDMINFRVNVLEKDASLPPHEEHSLVRTKDGLIGARLRFHLPVVTHDQAKLVLDGHVYVLSQGEIHLVNHGCVHSARNSGSSWRIHLVWDLLLTGNAFQCMFGANTSPELIRVPMDEWAPIPIASEKMGAFERIPPLVTPMEARNLCLLNPL